MKTVVLAAALAALGASAARAAAPAPTYETYAKLYDRLMAGATAAQLEDVLPGLAANLHVAQVVSSRHWTDSTPYDELAKAYILPDQALDGLGIRHEVSSGVVHVPAGVMHTYGYLFSQLKTAYGLKGKRWIESRLDERLGLPAGMFSPTPPAGEFTANVTSALLKLLGDDDEIHHAAKFEPKAKVVGYVEQDVEWTKFGGGSVKGHVFTHLIELAPLKGYDTPDAYLLVYSVMHGGKRGLVTAFPIEKGFAESIMKTPAAKSTAFTPRFNWYVNPAWTVVSQDNKGWKAL
jgi:hypothetical protein